jgi:biopolymer transport protein ExbB/TolQ
MQKEKSKVLPELLSKYQYLANPITLTVIGWLLLYLFLVFLIFFYRLFSLNSWIKKENNSLNSLIMGGNISTVSSLNSCIERSDSKKAHILNACIEASIKEGKKGLTFLAIVSSTAPFIGLFGTVVSILIAFGHMGNNTSLSLVAPAISEALIATAVGILVAIPAYSFHQVLVSKFDDLISTLKMQRDLISSDD